MQDRILIFSPGADSTLETLLPSDVASKLSDITTAVYVGRIRKSDGSSASQIRLFTKAEWDVLMECIHRKSHSAEKKQPYLTSYRYVLANSAECTVASGKLLLPATIADTAEIRFRARLFLEDGHWLMEATPSTYSEENSSVPLLQEWLEIESSDCNGTVWKGKARLLETDYETAASQLLYVLAEAHPKDLEKFSAEIFDALCIMAAHDDANAIDMTFWLCRSLSRTGYHTGVSPIGISVEQGANHALDALLRNGMDISFCGIGLDNTTFQLALLAFTAGNVDESFLLSLIDRGAEVTIDDVIGLYFLLENESLAAKIIMNVFKTDNNTGHGPTLLLNRWDEILGDSAQIDELKSLIGAEGQEKISQFRPFLNKCYQEVQNMASNAKLGETKQACDGLQRRLLENAELFVTQHAPEVKYYRDELAFFTTFFQRGDHVAHFLYGPGTVLGQDDFSTVVELDSGKRLVLHTIEAFLGGMIVVSQEEFQCRLYFSRSILKRGRSLLNSFEEAKQRAEKLRTNTLSQKELSAMKLFDVGSEEEQL